MPFITCATILSSFMSAVCIVGVIMVGNSIVLPVTNTVYTKSRRGIRNAIYSFKKFSMSQSALTIPIIKYVSNNCQSSIVTCLTDSKGGHYQVPTNQWVKVEVPVKNGSITKNVCLKVRINTTNETSSIHRNGLITGVVVKFNRRFNKLHLFDPAVHKLIELGNDSKSK